MKTPTTTRISSLAVLLLSFFWLAAALYGQAGVQFNALSIIPSTNDAFVGGLTFMEKRANGTNFIGFQAPDAVSANVVFTLADGDGLADQPLCTTGAATLLWCTSLFVEQAPNLTLDVDLVAGDDVDDITRVSWLNQSENEGMRISYTANSDVLDFVEVPSGVFFFKLDWGNSIIQQKGRLNDTTIFAMLAGDDVDDDIQILLKNAGLTNGFQLNWDQSADVLILEDHAGTDLFTFDDLGNVTLNSDRKVFWKDTAGTTHTMIHYDASNNLTIGPTTAAALDGDIIFYRDGVAIAKFQNIGAIESFTPDTDLTNSVGNEQAMWGNGRFKNMDLGRSFAPKVDGSLAIHSALASVPSVVFFNQDTDADLAAELEVNAHLIPSITGTKSLGLAGRRWDGWFDAINVASCVGCDSVWTDTGAVVHPQASTTRAVSIGSVSELGKLYVQADDINQITARVRAVASQTQNIFQVEDSAGTTEHLIVNAAGQVGIGPVAPTASSLLHVGGAGTIFQHLESSDNNPVQLRIKTDNQNRRIVAVTSLDATLTQVLLKDTDIILQGVSGADRFLTANNTELDVAGDLIVTGGEMGINTPPVAGTALKAFGGDIEFKQDPNITLNVDMVAGDDLNDIARLNLSNASENDGMRLSYTVGANDLKFVEIGPETSLFTLNWQFGTATLTGRLNQTAIFAVLAGDDIDDDIEFHLKNPAANNGFLLHFDQSAGTLIFEDQAGADLMTLTKSDGLGIGQAPASGEMLRVFGGNVRIKQDPDITLEVDVLAGDDVNDIVRINLANASDNDGMRISHTAASDVLDFVELSSGVSFLKLDFGNSILTQKGRSGDTAIFAILADDGTEDAQIQFKNASINNGYLITWDQSLDDWIFEDQAGANLMVINPGSTAIQFSLDLDPTSSFRDIGASGSRWDELWIDEINVSLNILPDADVGADIGASGTIFDDVFAERYVVGRSAARLGSIDLHHSTTAGTATIRAASVTAGVDVEVTRPVYPSAANSFDNGLATRRWATTFSNQLTLGNNACDITVVTGAPTGGCTTCDVRLRTDGTAGATLYVCEASAWAAK